MSETYPRPFGRYQLTERLAVGGMAELFRATVSGAHGFQKPVVIKRILPHLAADEHFNRMFIDEAKITARLSHPKIAQTLELGKFDGQLFIAMEYVDGLDVLAILRECAHRRSHIPIAVSVFVIQEVLDALDFAHNHVDAAGVRLDLVHRDISPSNVLVSRRGDVKLVDFGIAQATEREQHTQAGTLKGKYGYMAPEQVVGGQVDARSDLFSAGVVLAELVMGRRLFTAANELDVLLMVRDVRLDRLERYGAQLDPGLDALLRRALVKDREQRFQTAAEFREALAEWLFKERLRVSARELASLVNDLYDDAWARKRALKAALEAAAHEAAPKRAPNGQPRAGSGELGSRPPGSPSSAGPATSAPSAALLEPGSRPVPSGSIPRSTSLDEAISLVAHDDQGAPHREVLSSGDSEPLVLIERTGAGRPSLAEHGAPGPRASVRPEPAPARRTHALRPPTEDEASFADIDLDSVVDPPAPLAAPSDDDDSYDLGDLSQELELGPAGTLDVGSSPLGTRTPMRHEQSEHDEPGAHSTQEIAFDEVVRSVESRQRAQSAESFTPSDAELEQARRQRPAMASLDGAPNYEGDLSEVPSLTLLCRVAHEQSTGLLVVELGPIRKEIYIRQGCPVYVSSNVASELFGEYLVAQKVISDGELSMALAMMPHYGGKLGDTLVGLGLTKPLDVFRLLGRQVREKLIDVCTWGKGRFQWYEGRRNDREAFPLDLDPFEVIGAGAMRVSGARLEQWCAAVLDVKYKSTKASVQPEAFRLGAEVRTIYNQLGGTRTVGEMAMRYTDDVERDRFVRILFLLVCAELASPA